MKTIEVENADLNDAPMISWINHQHLISTKESLADNELEATGFLITPFTDELVHYYVNSEKYLSLTAKLDSKIVGYAIACDLVEEKDLNQLIETLPEWRKLNQQKVFYLSQIATKTEGEKGVGKQLMNSVLNYAMSHGYRYIVSQIIHAPIRNSVSITFHEKCGFRFIAEMVRKDKRVAGVYLKDLQK